MSTNILLVVTESVGEVAHACNVDHGAICRADCISDVNFVYLAVTTMYSRQDTMRVLVIVGPL